MLRRRDALILLASTALSSQAIPSRSEDWPERPLRIVVPFPAGGSADLTARLLAEDLRTHLRQNVIVENKPGAGGNLAAAEIARSSPDGNSVLIGTTGTHVFNQFIYRNPGFDAIKDFAPLGVMWSAPNVCVIHSSLSARTFDELVNFARAHPGSLSYGTSGIGVATHLCGELFQRNIGATLVHVPYRGQAQAITDLISGRIHMMFPIVPDILPHLHTPEIRALAITSAQRTLLLPDTPTVEELGHPDLVFSTWLGAFARNGTSPAIIDRLVKLIATTVESAEYRRRLAELGLESEPIFGDDFHAKGADEQRKWAKLIAEIGLKID
jgi:tripartite-type tricarboxylate transporter receptor subunit TctC